VESKRHFKKNHFHPTKQNSSRKATFKKNRHKTFLPTSLFSTTLSLSSFSKRKEEVNHAQY